MNRRIITILLCVLCCGSAWAQDTTAPFYQEVQHLKQRDSNGLPPKQAILFIGSSSFTKWVDVQDYFPGHTIVNRAFGGSTLPDVIRFADDIIFPYQPKQIVIYCGENDIASADSISAAIVFSRFKQLFNLIRSRLPGVYIAYVSMKPSPSREKFWPKMREANLSIKNFLQTKKHTAFIDVYHKMFNKDSNVMKDIFLEDNLHMNAKGYKIWQKAIAPYLVSTPVRKSSTALQQ